MINNRAAQRLARRQAFFVASLDNESEELQAELKTLDYCCSARQKEGKWDPASYWRHHENTRFSESRNKPSAPLRFLQTQWNGALDSWRKTSTKRIRKFEKFLIEEVEVLEQSLHTKE
jgi:hypothetical protein